MKKKTMKIKQAEQDRFDAIVESYAEMEMDFEHFKKHLPTHSGLERTAWLEQLVVVLSEDNLSRAWLIRRFPLLHELTPAELKKIVRILWPVIDYLVRFKTVPPAPNRVPAVFRKLLSK